MAFVDQTKRFFKRAALRMAWQPERIKKRGWELVNQARKVARSDPASGRVARQSGIYGGTTEQK